MRDVRVRCTRQNSIDVWVMPEKVVNSIVAASAQTSQRLVLSDMLSFTQAHKLFGCITNNTVTFESGGTVWVPAQPDQHMLRGLRYTATGTSQQLQQLSAKLIAQCLQAGQQLDSRADTQQWSYLNEQDTWHGPYSGTQLHKWNNSRYWVPDFAVCHGPSGIWLPVWLVLQLLGFPAASTTEADAAAAVSGHHQAGSGVPAQALVVPEDEEYGSASGQYCQLQQTATQYQRRHYHASGHQLTQRNSNHSTGTTPSSPHSDHEYGWRAPQQPISAATIQAATAAAGGITSSHMHSNNITHRPQVTSAAAGKSAAARAVGQYGTDERYEDADMSDWHAEVMHELQLLRQDSDFLQEVNRAVDMDWEPQQQQEQLHWNHQQQQGLQDGLAELATSLAGAGGGSSSSLLQHPQQWADATNTSMHAGLLVLVVDTNVLLDRRGLAVLRQVQGLRLQCAQPLLVVVPWTVLVELDKLKNRQAGANGALSVAAQARAALRHLQSVMTSDSLYRHMYRAQSVQEFRSAARDFNFGVPDKLTAADDRILQCALSCQQQVQHQQGPGKSGVILLTNDVAFRLKGQANGIRVASLKDLPATHNTGHSVQQQQLFAQLMHMAGFDMPDSNGRQEALVPTHPTAAAATAAAGLVPSEQHHWAAPAALQLHLHAYHQQQAALSSHQGSESSEALALSHITSLRLGLTSTVTAIFKSAFDELWLDVVSSKPPWRDGDFLHVLNKHWRSTFQDHLLPAAKHNNKQLELAVQYLITINKQLHNRRRSSNESSNTVQQEPQLQQNVAARVIQLLEAYGATAAAANVAAAAGLDWANSTNGAAGTLTSCQDGSLQTNTQGNSGSASLDAGKVASLAREGVHGAESRHLVPGATSALLLGGFVQGLDGVGLAPCQQQHEISHMTIQQPASQTVDGVKCAEEGSSAVTSPRCYAHASRHDQQRLAAVAASAAAGSGAMIAQVGIGLAVALHGTVHHQQQQHQGSQQQTLYAAGQQLVPSTQHYEQQPWQLAEMHHAATSGQQQQLNVLYQVSSACAAVPAPQQQGPCFRLQQLVEYAGALCQAAVPVLQLLHTSQGAAVWGSVSAVTQRLQGIVHLMNYVSGTLPSMPYEQWQQQAPEQGSLAANLQGQVLQLGQQLVQLCCLLLSDAAACNRVSGQLTEHELSFVTDGISYLLLQHQHRAELGPAAWQLQAILQQLQSLL